MGSSPARTELRKLLELATEEERVTRGVMEWGRAGRPGVEVDPAASVPAATGWAGREGVRCSACCWMRELLAERRERGTMPGVGIRGRLSVDEVESARERRGVSMCSD